MVPYPGYTHGFAGLAGGLMAGLVADPKMIVYLGVRKSPGFSAAGLLYGNPRQLLVQALAALTVIVWSGLMTFLILRGIGLFMKLRMTDAELEAGDIAAHDEVAYPAQEVPERVPALIGARAGARPVPRADDDGPDDPFLDAEQVLTE